MCHFQKFCFIISLFMYPAVSVLASDLGREKRLADEVVVFDDVYAEMDYPAVLKMAEQRWQWMQTL